MNRLPHLVAAAVVVVAMGSACSSSSSPSAEDQVCTARANLNTAYQQLTSDVRSLNLSSAKAQIPKVQSAFDDLVTAEKSLASDKRAQIDPDLQQAKSSLTSISGATSLAQVGAALDSAQTSLNSVLTTVKSTANCS
jgi:hypothetical protein